jgi:hypothetical protein
MRFDMNVRTSLCLSALATLLLIASGAQGAVYRCAQSGGAVLYSDYPCDGASVVDIRPGSADPNAKERLARAQAELDRAAAERRAREQFEAARREEMAREAQAAPYMTEPPPPDAYYGTAYDFYAPFVPADRLRDGAHRRASFKAKEREKRVPQVVRTPHPPR